MDRRMKTIVRAGLLAAVAISAVLLAACSDVNIISLLTTEVKRANNKFLIINAIAPTAPSNVNPGAPIVIEFDRPLTEASLNSNSIVISPNDLLTSSFILSNGNKTLSIEPDPYLKDNTTYNIRVTLAVLGEDGSTLEQERTWSFQTGVYPAGALKVTDGLGTEVTYTRLLQPHFTITYKAICDKYRVNTDGTAFSNFTDPDAGWRTLSGPSPWTFPSSDLTSPLFSLPTGDGAKTIYIQFLRTATGDRSLVRSDVVVLDQTPPSVDAGPQRWVNASATATPAPSASDTNGIKSYLWTGVACTTAANIAIPTFSNPGVDGNYIATLTVTDNADNTSFDTMTLARDSVAPSFAPTFLSVPTSPSISPAPLWSWQGNSINANGGVSPKLFRYRLNFYDPREDSWKPYDAYATQVTDTQYTPAFEPPKAMGLPNSTYRNTAYEPILYRMSVWEMDYASNLSPAATAADVALTSVLPSNGESGVGLTPTLSWRPLYEPRSGEPSRYYMVYIGYYPAPGKWEYITRAEIALPKVGNPYWLVYKAISLKAGVTYGWYVEASDFSMRSPLNGVIYRDDFWTFTP